MIKSLSVIALLIVTIHCSNANNLMNILDTEAHRNATHHASFFAPGKSTYEEKKELFEKDCAIYIKNLTTEWYKLTFFEKMQRNRAGNGLSEQYQSSFKRYEEIMTEIFSSNAENNSPLKHPHFPSFQRDSFADELYSHPIAKITVVATGFFCFTQLFK